MENKNIATNKHLKTILHLSKNKKVMQIFYELIAQMKQN